jgi:periplasmic divalent cation tolerance protein
MEASVSSHIVVFVTAGSADEGRTIGRALVNERLGACVSIIPSLESVYRWQGRVHHDQEVLLLVKTTAAALERLVKRVKQLHSYDTPEIIALPIVAGADDYLRWIDQETQPPGPSTQTIEVRADGE